MANVSTVVSLPAPLGGAANDGSRIVTLDSTAKAAQNDTITITNCNSVLQASLVIVATGAAETYTVSNNVITLTSATTGNVRGILVVK